MVACVSSFSLFTEDLWLVNSYQSLLFSKCWSAACSLSQELLLLLVYYSVDRNFTDGDIISLHVVQKVTLVINLLTRYMSGPQDAVFTNQELLCVFKRMHP